MFYFSVNAFTEDLFQLPGLLSDANNFSSFNRSKIYPDSVIDNLEPIDKSIKNLGNRKDPFFAGILSFVFPGSGQIYAEEYSKGIIFGAVDVVGKASLITLSIFLTDKYTSESTGDNHVDWRELTGSDRTIVISMVLSYIIFLGYNVYDAVDSSNAYNSNYYQDIPISIMLDTESSNINFNYNLKF